MIRRAAWSTAALTFCWSKRFSTRSIKGGVFRDCQAFRRAQDPPAADGVGHVHSARQQSRRDRANRRGILEFDFPRAAIERGHELRVGSQGNAPADRRAGADRADLCQLLSQRGPSRSAPADGFSGNARVSGAAIA